MSAIAPVVAGLPMNPPVMRPEGGAMPGMGELGSVDFGESLRGVDATAPNGEMPFVDYMKEAVATHVAHAREADGAAKAFAEGRLDDIHGTMIGMKEAGIELRLISNVRTKILDAFQELWRLNV